MGDSTVHPRRTELIAFLGIFLLYVLLRLLAWGNASELEDQDSTAYLGAIETFRTLDVAKIRDMSPDMTPFYPMLSAAFSVPAGSVEMGARICSFVFSCLLFLALWRIGRRIASPFVVGIGLLILSFNPTLIRLSYSVLTEPSYIATVYAGFWLFLIQYRQPTVLTGVGAGAVFALAFLNRIEGILFFIGVPFLQVAHFVLDKERRYQMKDLVTWTAAFMLVFTALSAGQVWRVSEKMGSFALNGRQVWSMLLSAPDGKSYEEKIYGLDYSPSQINLSYLQEHPERLQEGTRSVDIISYLKLIAVNLDDLSQRELSRLVGIISVVFFGIGIVRLYEGRFRVELFFFLVFIAIGLVGPVLHNVVLRHIAIIAPMMALIAGVGIVHTARVLANSRHSA